MNVNGVFYPGNVGERFPEHGDLTVCANCRAFLAFDLINGPYRLRLITVEEIAELPDALRNELNQARRILQGMKRSKEQRTSGALIALIADGKHGES